MLTGATQKITESASELQETSQLTSSASLDIKAPRRSSFNAPTPINTPLNTVSLTSDSLKNSIKAMSEKKESQPEMSSADVGKLLAQNPQLINAIQGRLDALVGKSSGYIESLPKVVQRRIRALEKLTHDQAELEAKFREELLELEKKYLKMYQPLYEKRADIVNGRHEPTTEELAPADEESESESDKEETENAADENTNGIPEFWLTIFKNSPVLDELISEKDQEVLKKLRDVRVVYPDGEMCFRLEFDFEENDYFTNTQLTKTYYLQNQVDADCNEIIYDRCEGCEIDWKAEKNITVKVELRKQRHKGTGKTRVVKRTVPDQSFFNFFKAPEVNEDAEDEDEAVEAYEEALGHDYEVADHFTEAIIPRAVDWFTGRAAMNYAQENGEFDDEEFDSSEEDDDEQSGEEHDSEGDDDNPKAKHQPNSQPPPECKQQ